MSETTLKGGKLDCSALWWKQEDMWVEIFTKLYKNIVKVCFIIKSIGNLGLIK